MPPLAAFASGIPSHSVTGRKGLHSLISDSSYNDSAEQHLRASRVATPGTAPLSTLRRLMTGTVVHRDGSHYTAAESPCSPSGETQCTPVQRPDIVQQLDLRVRKDFLSR